MLLMKQAIHLSVVTLQHLHFIEPTLKKDHALEQTSPSYKKTIRTTLAHNIIHKKYYAPTTHNTSPNTHSNNLGQLASSSFLGRIHAMLMRIAYVTQYIILLIQMWFAFCFSNTE